MTKEKVRKRFGARVTLSGLVLAIAMSVLGAAPAQGAAVSSACSADLVIIGVRGTNAPAGSNLGPGGRVWKTGGFGTNVTPVIDAIKRNFPAELNSYIVSLKYPATAEINLIDNSAAYINSRNAGATALKAELGSYMSCATRPMVVLVGYSQGADVIATTLGSQMDATARAQVKGAVLFGDPGYRPNQPINSPLTNPGSIGMFPRTNSVQTLLNSLRNYGYSIDIDDYGWRQVVRSYCRAGDAACQGNYVNWDIHSDYSMYKSNAVEFIENFIYWG